MNWINIKDRLPIKGQWVWIYCWRGIIQASYWEDSWRMHEINTMGQRFELSEVTHWMPLPEPPTE